MNIGTLSLITVLTLGNSIPIFNAGVKLANTIFVDSVLNFDSSYVLDDLYSSKEFSISNYPISDSKTPEIISFTEYAYDKDKNYENYGLYVYVYNPQLNDFALDSIYNKIQLATNNNAYFKYSLKFLNKNDDSRFLKFKVDLTDDEKIRILGEVNTNKRIYKVSGIELKSKKGTNAIDYFASSSTKQLGGIYQFSGYSKGYGSDTSTLVCDVEDLETLQLDVKSTYYRTNSSSLGYGHQNQLDSVYFNVPKTTLEKYGSLCKVKAEWYELKTKPVIVSMPSDYETFKKYIGISQTSSNYCSKSIVAWEKAAALDVKHLVAYEGLNTSLLGEDEYISNALYWLFNGGDDYKNCTITTSQIKQYINYYNKSSSLLFEKFPQDLFLNKVDEGRTFGYNVKEFDSYNDQLNLLSYDSTHNGWNRFWDYFGSWGNDTSSGYYNIDPIHQVTASDVNQNGSSLFINDNDFNDFKTYYNNKGDNETFLFRFANTDYVSKYIYTYNTNALVVFMGEPNGYFFSETCFLDFDIIDLTFNKDGVYKNIAAVSNPLDIIDDGTSPSDKGVDWVKILKMILSLLLGIGILWAIGKVFSILGINVKDIINLLFIKPYKAIKRKIKGKKHVSRKNKR